MIDIHSHMLPHFDDGARSWEESLTMADKAVNDGITAVVCTPHYTKGSYENSREAVEKAIIEFKKQLRQKGLLLQVFPGMEVHVYNGVVDDLKSRKLITLNNTQYVLLELSPHFLPPSLNDIIWELTTEGYIPIMAHPERYGFTLRQPAVLESWVDKGVLIQITAASLKGVFGREVKRFSLNLLKHRLVHLVATDSHGLGHRNPRLSYAYQMVCEELGEDWAKKIFWEVPAKIIQGESLVPWEYVPLLQKNRKTRLGKLRAFLNRVNPL